MKLADTSWQNELRELLLRNPDLSLEGVERRVQSEAQTRHVRKYGNQPTEVDGIRFDSRKEAQRYVQLRDLERMGAIRDLTLQPEFVLLESFEDAEGERHPAIRYRADFRYVGQDGVEVIEDVKSVATAKNAVFRLKWKWLLYLHRNDNARFRLV